MRVGSGSSVLRSSKKVTNRGSTNATITTMVTTLITKITAG
jgi:hypothetical protein